MLGGGAEDGLQLLEGRLGPDHESSEVASRRQLQDAQTVHVAEVQARQVSECAQFLSLTIVHEQRAAFLLEASVSLLSDACTDLLGLLGGVDVVGHTQFGEQLDTLLGLLYVDVNVNDERQLSEFVDAVSAALDERGQG